MVERRAIGRHTRCLPSEQRPSRGGRAGKQLVALLLAAGSQQRLEQLTPDPVGEFALELARPR
jgi:hypothetical protein